MSDDPGALFAGAAASFEGVPFRLHGRTREGTDCVGLVALALTAAGHEADLPVGYSLRTLSLAPLLEFAGRNGFAAATEPTRPGDLLLVRPGPLQAHLVIASLTGGFVHAHAGLGRVVHEQRSCPWAVLARWRLIESASSWQP